MQELTIIISILSFLGTVILGFVTRFLNGRIDSSQKRIDELNSLNITERHKTYKRVIDVLYTRITMFNKQMEHGDNSIGLSDDDKMKEAEIKKEVLIFADKQVLDLYLKQDYLYKKNDLTFFKYFAELISIVRVELFDEPQVKSIIIAQSFFTGDNDDFYKRIGFSQEDIDFLKRHLKGK